VKVGAWLGGSGGKKNGDKKGALERDGGYKTGLNPGRRGGQPGGNKKGQFRIDHRRMKKPRGNTRRGQHEVIVKESEKCNGRQRRTAKGGQSTPVFRRGVTRGKGTQPGCKEGGQGGMDKGKNGVHSKRSLSRER